MSRVPRGSWKPTRWTMRTMKRALSSGSRKRFVSPCLHEGILPTRREGLVFSALDTSTINSRLGYLMNREPGGASHLVLVVEDDADIRESLQMLLEGEGYAVAVAANGREAVE